MDKLLNILSASVIKGIGPKKILNIIYDQEYSNLNNYKIFIDFISQKFKLQITNNDFENARNFACRQLDYAQKNNVKILLSNNKEYPSLLRNSKYDPGIIFVKGLLNNNVQKSIGVIGTRFPTEIAQIITERITRFLSKQNCSVISGLAIGCDTIAHREAIKNSSHTIAVLAHGLDIIAPKQNQNLANQIVESGGALISTYPFFIKPQPYFFASRDKIQAALSEKIVMVQSGQNGGSLIASRAILDLNRKLVVPYPPKKDLEYNLEKNSANLTFANAENFNDLKKLKNFNQNINYSFNILKNNIIILKSKEDYYKLTA